MFNFKDIKVLVIGDAMVDHYVQGDVCRISPEAPVPVLSCVHEFDRAGGAANVARNVASFSENAVLVCLAGYEDYNRLKKVCGDNNLRALLINVLKNTPVKTRYMASNQQLLRVDRDAKLDESGYKYKKAVEEVMSVINELAKDMDAILVSDYNKGIVFYELMEYLKSLSIPLIVDPKPKKDLNRSKQLYKGSTIITPNKKEAYELLGCNEMSSDKLARLLSEEYECNVVLTLGSEGMCICMGSGVCEQIPTEAKDVYDVAGAGDTVASLIALCVGSGYNLLEAAKIANKAAGIVVGKLGTDIVTKKELLDVLGS